MKKLLSYLMVLLTVFMVSCASPLGQYQYTLNTFNKDSIVRDVPIWVDLSFDNDDQALIKEAIDQWNYALNGWMHFHIEGYIFVDDAVITSPREGWLFTKALSTDRVVKNADKVDPESGYCVLGFVNYIGGNQLFIIRERLSKEEVLGTILHEIGHLLGAKHFDNGLMGPHFNQYLQQCIDKKTIEEVAEHEKLPIETLNYCTLD